MSGRLAVTALLQLALSLGAERQIRFEHLTGEDGISNEYVFQILQDHHGFLWFSTTNGLNRYDGYRVVTYRDVPTRMFHTVSAPGLLYEDQSGTLWVGTDVLAKFDPGNGTVTRFNPPHPGQAICSLHDDGSGFLWLGMHAPVLYRFDPRAGAFVEHKLSLNVTEGNSGIIYAIEHDKTGMLWLATSYGVVRFDPSSGESVAYRQAPANPAIRDEARFNSVVWDKNGKLWVHVPGGLERFDPATGVFDRFTKINFWHMAADTNGMLWLYGGWPGLQLFDPQSGSVTVIRQYAITPSGSERDDGLGALLPDRAGNVWVNFRRSGGLDRYTPAVSRFGKFLPVPGDPTALSGGPVRGFAEDSEGKIWIATSGYGLNKFDPATGTFIHFQHHPGRARSLDSDEVYSMHQDRSGRFWVGTYKGIGTFNRRSGEYSQLRGPIDAHEFTSIREDRSGRFWVGDWLGRLHLLNRQTGQTTLADVSGGHATYEDRAGNLWFGSFPKGLSKLDPSGRVRRISLAETAGSSSPEPTAVYSFYEDPNGMLWLSTQSGLFRFDPISEKSTRYTTRNGLPENAIMCAVPDDLGNLWLSTFQGGISRLNLKENRFYNYDASNGLQGNLFTSGACYAARDGRLYFGGRAGFNAFYPREVLGGGWPEPRVVITEFQVHDKWMSLLPQPIWNMEVLELSPEQNGFSFGFSALDYVQPRKTRYRFKLEGLENRWTEADSGHRYARYTDIEPGAYVFRVQASTDGRTWGEKGASLRLILAPPWWKTPWGRGGAVLLLLVAIAGGHKLRVKVLKEQEKQLREQVEQRTAELVEARDQAQAANRAKSEFLAHMSHELRTPLNAILGFSNLLREDGVSEKQRKDLDIINRSGEHLLELINDVLDVAKIEAGSKAVVNAPCDLKALVHDVTEMMCVRAEKKNLKLLALESPTVPGYVRTDAAKLRQVLINLLGNAVKYTERGAVTLHLDATPQGDLGRLLLTFQVEDTGTGIAAEDQEQIFEAFVRAGKPNQKGSGLGLTITRQCVELMGGTIRFESTLGQGSLFRVELPVERAGETEVITPVAGMDRIIGLSPGQPEYRILIVEDEQENWMVLERLLQHAGFRVRVAKNGEQGVEVFQDWQPQFIWMDVRMPVMDGLVATQRIRALKGGREVKIAAVTASVFASERDEVLAAGMDDFVRKPYRPREIYDCLARHLGVRFRVSEAGPKALPLRPEALAELPEALRVELTTALISLDTDRIASAIEHVSERDSGLADVLAQCAERLAFTQMLQALEMSQFDMAMGRSGVTSQGQAGDLSTDRLEPV